MATNIPFVPSMIFRPRITKASLNVMLAKAFSLSSSLSEIRTSVISSPMPSYHLEFWTSILRSPWDPLIPGADPVVRSPASRIPGYRDAALSGPQDADVRMALRDGRCHRMGFDFRTRQREETRTAPRHQGTP